MRDCYFCKRNIQEASFKDINILSRFIDDWGKIKAPRITGLCAKHQRKISKAIKKARILGLMPFVNR
jgi:small subunit ribosomal protein S18